MPGDSDVDETVKKRSQGRRLSFSTPNSRRGTSLAVTGGTTLAEVARSLPSSHEEMDVVIIPARGGLGEEVEL